MNKVSSTRDKHQETWSWHRLQGIVNPAVFAAPRLNWERVDGRCIRYLVQTVGGSPWVEHLAHLSNVLTSHAGLDPNTILGYLRTLHPRWRALFSAYVCFPRFHPDARLRIRS